MSVNPDPPNVHRTTVIQSFAGGAIEIVLCPTCGYQVKWSPAGIVQVFNPGQAGIQHYPEGVVPMIATVINGIVTYDFPTPFEDDTGVTVKPPNLTTFEEVDWDKELASIKSL